MLLVTNISVAISSGLSLKEAIITCKTFTDTGGSRWTAVRTGGSYYVYLSICTGQGKNQYTCLDKIIYEK